MRQNFLECGREQAFLMPPDPRLAAGGPVGVVRVGVGGADRSVGVLCLLSPGRLGRAAFEPRMMVALLLYAYARGERSSRGIERRCVEDVAYRVIAMAPG
jgi:hypothetical protein